MLMAENYCSEAFEMAHLHEKIFLDHEIVFLILKIYVSIFYNQLLLPHPKLQYTVGSSERQ